MYKVVINIITSIINNDKSFIITDGRKLYKNENNADNFLVYIPNVLDGHNIKTSSIFLRILLPDKSGYSFQLEYTKDYNDYSIYSFSFPDELTNIVGEIILSISIVFGDDDNTIIKTSETFLYVDDSISTDDIIDDDDKDQLDWLTSKIIELDNNKADDIIYNTSSNSLQLSSNDIPIGDEVTLNNGENGVIIFGGGE